MPAIPICPLMSAGQEVPHVCMQEKCAWFMSAPKTCAIFIMAHDALLCVKEKQGGKK